jgi:hypothetical protein
VAFALFLVWGSGCGANKATDQAPEKTPDEQFKAIADARKRQLSEALKNKNSELSGWKATVTEETDIDKKIEFPYVGKIEVQYRVGEARAEGESRSFLTNTVTAEYRYSRNEKKWVYVGSSRSPKDDPQVALFYKELFDVVSQVFAE